MRIRRLHILIAILVLAFCRIVHDRIVTPAAAQIEPGRTELPAKVEAQAPLDDTALAPQMHLDDWLNWLAPAPPTIDSPPPVSPPAPTTQPSTIVELASVIVNDPQRPLLFSNEAPGVGATNARDRMMQVPTWPNEGHELARLEFVDLGSNGSPASVESAPSTPPATVASDSGPTAVTTSPGDGGIVSIHAPSPAVSVSNVPSLGDESFPPVFTLPPVQASNVPAPTPEPAPVAILAIGILVTRRGRRIPAGS
jgi:hypothetical protein